MNQGEQTGAVIEFYDLHPINEAQILEKLRRDGHDPDAVTQDVLQDYDQDHYGGVAANDVLASLAEIDRSCHVLDVCCGMGGPSRYLALNYGCRVTGVDLVKSRVDGARALTRLTGLDDRVQFVNADALDMPFADRMFDVVISQEAFCHVPDKDRLISQCCRVLTSGGRFAFTDIVVTGKTSSQTRARLQQEMAFQELASAEDYRDALLRGACPLLEYRDLSEQWRDILNDRLQMYRGLKQQTIDRFGQAHFDKWDAAYSFFVGLYETGELGGGQFLARRDERD